MSGIGDSCPGYEADEWTMYCESLRLKHGDDLDDDALQAELDELPFYTDINCD